MNFKKISFAALGCMVLSIGATSCVDDLDVTPKNPSNKTELTTGEEYWQSFAQVYSGLVIAGVNDKSDITVDDGGAGVYTRQLWNLQELCSDEAFIGKNWNDAGLDELDYSTWSADNHWLYEAMSRFCYQISICNEFLRTIDKAATVANPISADDIKGMKAEVRALRALSYYHMMDIFGRGPWSTEADKVGETPVTMTRAEMFPLVVADLVNAIPDIKPAAQQRYGRVSREGAYMLLAKLYLNAGVYTGTPMWTECADACREIIKTVNTLAPEYKYLFCGTNDRYVGNGEILWAIPQDNSNLQTYGGTTYLGIGAWNESIPEELYHKLGSTAAGWGGPRVRPELADAFSSGDPRYLIYEGTFTNDLNDIGDWGLTGSGYMCIKYSYASEDDYDNTQGVYYNTFSNTDFPLFRLADTYLMLAECQLRGVECNGKYYFDQVRARASQPAIELNDYNLLQERMRELYWEGHRRSDLIRFGQYSGNQYLWSWKGGVQQGQSVPAYREVYAIPTNYTATLGQNPGY